MQNKNQIIELKIDNQTMDMLDEARNLIQMDRDSFIRLSIQEKAHKVLSDSGSTVFTEKDWENFFDRMDEPVKLSSRMKNASIKHREILRD